MDSGEDDQDNNKTNDSEDYTGITIQSHTAFVRKHVGSNEKGNTERRVYHHNDGGKDKAYSEGR